MARSDVYEPPLTRKYWSDRGRGTLVEKFRMARREFDGLIIDELPHESRHWRDRGRDWWAETAGRPVTVVQTKAAQLEMPLMGQTLFSCELVGRHLAAASVSGVAVCAHGDPELRDLLAAESRFCLTVAIVPNFGTYKRPARHPRLLSRYFTEVMRVRGTLVRSVPIGDRAVADAVVFADRREDCTLRDRDVTILHTAKPLGVSVMGLAYFSARLVERRHRPARVRSIALCTNAPDDLASLFDNLRPTVDFDVLA